MPEKGASLIELILVVGVVGLLVALAGQSFVGATSRYHDKSVTTELAAELRTARHLAITRREPVRVVFESEGMRLRTERVNAPGLPLRQYEYPGRGIVVEHLSNGPSVVFYPSGRAATPTTITLRNARQQRWQLTVSLTGRVSVSWRREP